MLPFEDRYTRQRQLVEVGIEGQTRLARSPYKLAEYGPRSLVAAQVATDYLQRAGVQVIVSDTTLEPKLVGHETQALTLASFRFEGPLQVATGALAALDHIRSVLSLK